MTGPRILHVVTDSDRRGGQLAGLALHDELQVRGWDSSIVALAPGTRGGLNVDALGKQARRPSTLRRLRALARSADVVVAHGSTTLPAAALALPRSTPFVYVNIGDPRGWLTTKARKVRTRYFLRRAAAVAAISPRSADVLHRWVGMPSERIEVLPNFRDPQVFHPLDSRLRRDRRQALGWSAEEAVVLWMGAMTPEKRPDLALDVAQGLPAFRLVLAGDGPLADGLRARAEALGANMVGVVDDPWRWLVAADVLLLTSETEGVPGVLIEAGMCGVPAVSTDVGFVRDVVRDGQSGRLVRPGDIAGLVDGVREAIDARADWGPAAKAHCTATFATEVVVPAWEELLRSVAAGRG